MKSLSSISNPQVKEASLHYQQERLLVNKQDNDQNHMGNLFFKTLMHITLTIMHHKFSL